MENEIVKMVAKKANISEPVAQIAVDAVLNILKNKLPPALGSTLDALLGSDSSSANSKKSSTSSSSKKSSTSKKSSKKDDNPLGDIGDIVGKLGGLFGKK